MTKLIIIFLCSSKLLFANDFINFFSNINSFSADFVQTADGKTSSGKLQFLRPKSIKFHTLKPNENILLLHNNKITLYNVWLKSANIVPYKKYNLLEYLIQKPTLKNAPHFSHSFNGYKYYIANNIKFSFKDGLLCSIETINSSGSRVLVELSNLILNPKLTTNDFIIEFNPNVDVMHEF